MNPTQKQFSLNRGASRKQIPISKYADFEADAFGTFVTTYARGNENVNVYESFQSIRIMVEDFGFTGNSGISSPRRFRFFPPRVASQ